MKNTSFFQTLFSKVLGPMAWNWVKRYFNHNPLIERPSEYLNEFGNALRFGFKAIGAVMGLAFVVYGGLVFAILNNWL